MRSGTGKFSFRQNGNPKNRAFSLLELLVTLAVIAMFSGFFLLRFDVSRTESMLRNAVADVKSAALKAKGRSYAFRRDHYIIFSKNRFWITDRPPLENGSPIPSPREDEETFKLDPDLIVQYRTEDRAKWKKGGTFVWTFRDSGLNDPLSIRFSNGRSYSLMSFNVLTGRAEEETVLE